MIAPARLFVPPVASLLLILWAPSARAQGAAPLPPLPAPASEPPIGSAPAPALAPPPPPAPPPVLAPAPAPDSASAPDSAPAPAPDDTDRPPSNGCPGNTRIRCHDRFFLRLALGVGVTNLAGQGPVGDVSITGVSIPIDIAIGGTVGKGVVIGGTLFGAGTPFGASVSGIPSVKGQFGGLGTFIDWYPRPQAGWHFGGALGLGLVTITSSSHDSGGDIAASVFGGYDWWIGEQWSVGAMLVGSAASSTGLKDTADADTGYKLSAASFGVLGSILFH